MNQLLPKNVLAGLLSLLATFSFAQNNLPKSYFGIKAGYLQSMNTVDVNQPNFGIRQNVADRPGFYAGGFYHRNISRLLGYQIDFSYQEKGLIIKNIPGLTDPNDRFSYVSLTPVIGLQPLRGLGFYVGPEMNVLVRGDRSYNIRKPLEVGGLGRIAYHYKQIGVEARYFQAFTYYGGYTIADVVTYHLTSRNWQLGLYYNFR